MTLVRNLTALMIFSLCATQLFSSVEPLETERLELRQARLSDTHDLAKIILDPEVRKLTGLFPARVQTVDGVQTFISDFLIGNSEQNIAPKYPISWVVVEKESQETIGLVTFAGVAMHDKRAELAYAFNPKYWNKGYATEACKKVLSYGFCQQGLHRIYATVDPQNVASKRVLEKINMSLEGLLRHYMIVNGQYRDRAMYAIIAD